MKAVTVLGGGIVGLSSAWFLRNAGYNVTVVDQGDIQEGCSYGNAGMIVPSHIVPLAAPGMVGRGIRWMFSAQSPFYVRPRFDLRLMRWGYQFYRHATAGHVQKSIPALRDLSHFSKNVYRTWASEMPFDFGYQERGLLMLYKRADAEEEEVEASHVANQAGVEAHVLAPGKVQELEPDVRVQVRGGVYYPGDAHFNPRKLMEHLYTTLKREGVKFLTRTEVSDVRIESGRVAALVTTSKEELGCENLVLATGAWSGLIGEKMGIDLPMQAGKGYSFTLNDVVKNVHIPSILLEARVAVTPMGSMLRFGGTMEIVGVDHTVHMNRVKGIVDAIPEYYPDMRVSLPGQSDVWHGLRPCSPDGLPYIGRATQLSNVVIATGHAMLGMSLGPGTGKIVSEIIEGKGHAVNIGAFDPGRYA